MCECDDTTDFFLYLCGLKHCLVWLVNLYVET